MSTHFWALSLLAGGVVVMGVTGLGCGGGNATGATGSGGKASSGPSTAAAVGGGGPMTTNHSFDKASPITIDGMSIAATLVDVNTPDFYTFSGTKGDMVIINAVAENNGTNLDTFDPSFIDTAVTLYDADKNQIAADNDEWPNLSTDSQLFAELPSTGTFYIKVEDCNSYAQTHTKVLCNDMPATGVTTFDYTLGFFHTSSVNVPEANAGTSQTGMTANAVTVKYMSQSAGVYGFSLIDGNFKSTTDTHVFAFTPPMDAKVPPPGRARAELFIQPPGADDGDGSTSNFKIWVTDDTAGQHVVARIDDTKSYTTGDEQPVDGSGPADLSFPVKLGQPYYLFVKSTAATSNPVTDYYFIQHVLNIYYATPEQSTPHDTSATAQVLGFPNPKAPVFYAVDGDIAAPGTATTPDVDWYKMTVPAMVDGMLPTQMGMSCDVARAGSGLVGFTAAFYDETGMTQLGATVGPEMANPTQGFFTSSAINVTASATVLVKYTAAMQDATNTGTSYRCFIQFQ